MTVLYNQSDRGEQYCCPVYTGLATNKGFIMSTTQQSDPYENAIAERINGILIWLEEKIASVDIARKIIKQAVDIYNNK
jgi:hypothetical protein